MTPDLVSQSVHIVKRYEFALQWAREGVDEAGHTLMLEVILELSARQSHLDES